MMRDDGVPVDAEMVDPDAAPPAYRAGRYHGGQILRGNGVIHAGLYHAGLLQRAARDGARIVGHCPVQAIARDGNAFRVTTARGRVRTGHVIVATNGYTPRAAQWLRRRVVPVDAFMIATEPLPAERVETIAPAGRPMVEHCHSPCWIRAERGPHADTLRRAQRRAARRPRPQGAQPARRHGADRACPGRREDQPLLDRQDGLSPSTCCPIPGATTVSNTPWAGAAPACPWGPIWAIRPRSGCSATRRRRAPSTGGPFPARPFYTGRPWFLPLAVAWHKRKDRKLFKG